MDATNPPFGREAAFQRDDGGFETSTKDDSKVRESNLKIDNMLLEEFNYAGVTAYQAMEDRARIFQLYLLIIGVLGSGLGAAYQLGGKDAKLQPLTIALLFVGGILGTAFFISLIRLRNAHQESLRSMNKVKEYYISHFKSQMADIEQAFRWREKTIPTGEKFGSVTFVICHTVAMLGSLSYAGLAVVVWNIIRNGDNGLPLALPTDLQPYLLALIVFCLLFLLHAIYFQSAFRASKPKR